MIIDTTIKNSIDQGSLLVNWTSGHMHIGDGGTMALIAVFLNRHHLSTVTYP